MSTEQSVSNGSESQKESASTDGTATQEETTIPVASTEQTVQQNVSAQDDEKKPRARIQLNPTGDMDQFRAIPSRDGDAASVPESTGEPTALELTEQPDEQQPGGGGIETIAPKATATSPVEVPPEITDLDQKLEAEIEAALAGVEQGTEALQAEAEQATSEAQSSDATLEEFPEEGSRQTGLVQSVHGDNVFLDLGYRSPGVVPVRQFQTAKPPAVGQQLEVTVDRVEHEEGLILVSLPSGRQRLSGNWDDVSVGQIVDCIVTKTNKGGLEVNISNLRGFLPAGQIDFKYVAELEPFIGQKLTVKIIEAKREKRNLVVSRRAYLEIQRKEAEKELWQTLDEGQVLSGTVKTIKDYGAFIDIGGVDGFLHIGQVSWSRIGHPSEVLHEGQTIEVKVLKLDRDNKKISLGMKQLLQDPWKTVSERYPTGKIVAGQVTRTMDFGAFVQLEQGIEGMVHVSELDYKRVKKVTDVLNVGQEIDVQVLVVDPERKRIALSLKALKPKPVEEELEPEVKEKQREADANTAESDKGPLKGGIGETGSGLGLFGNPRDFS